MGKLFFIDNDLKRLSMRISKPHPRTGKAKENYVRILFERREVPDKITEDVYGFNLTDADFFYDPWSARGPACRRAHFDAHIKIGDICATMTMQEAYNLVHRLVAMLDNHERMITGMNFDDAI